MLTVIICTYNRADSLRVTLNDFVHMFLPVGHTVELLVVDNNSTDETSRVIHEFEQCERFPIRYIRETEQGLSHARNRGIREARGEWIVFTDDDVRIEADWLQALVAHLPPCAAAVGGRVLPIWPEKLPSWVATEGRYLQQGVFIHYDLGPISRPICPEDVIPFGCNMAFHASLFEKYDGFRGDLGRKGRRLLSGEDTEMFSRLLSAGVPVYYISEALVRHPVEARRLTTGYFVRWKFWVGYVSGRDFGDEQTRKLFGVPHYRFRMLLAAVKRLLCAILPWNPPALAFQIGGVCTQVGFVIGVWFGRNGKAANRD